MQNLNDKVYTFYSSSCIANTSEININLQNTRTTRSLSKYKGLNYRLDSFARSVHMAWGSASRGQTTCLKTFSMPWMFPHVVRATYSRASPVPTDVEHCCGPNIWGLWQDGRVIWLQCGCNISDDSNSQITLYQPVWAFFFLSLFLYFRENLFIQLARFRLSEPNKN